MILLKFILSFGLVGGVASAALSTSEKTPGCGEVNVIFTCVSSTKMHSFEGRTKINLHSGLPPYHPLVTQQGFKPEAIDAALRADAANILKAGYNLRGKS
jgi:hypothetical protein